MKTPTCSGIGCLIAFCLTNTTFAQGTFDLEPPITASPLQIGRSPDPAKLHSYQFATAEIDDKGDMTIAVKAAKQTLLAPSGKTFGTEFDPRGIRVTEQVEREYTVFRKVIEKDKDGNDIEVSKPEKKTRTVTTTRYRDRTPKEQEELEKRIAERKAKEESGEIPKSSTSQRIQEEYATTISKRVVNKEGKEVTVRTIDLRKRNVVVQRGESITEEKIDTKVYRAATVKCYSIDGAELDQATIRTRLGERKPVILIPNTNSITPFFENLLSPDAVFVVTPEDVLPPLKGE